MIRRNVRSNLQKKVYIAGAKLHLLKHLFVNMPSNFLKIFRIDFESIHRNVSSDLQKEVSIAGSKLHLLEPLFVNMPSNIFRISESISSPFTEILGPTFKKQSS